VAGCAVSHAVWIGDHVLRDGGCPAKRVVEADLNDADEVIEVIHVVKLDYELGPGQTLQQVAEGYAGLRNLRVVTP
jgi:hypothetical protein